jgi:hypothetical protein
MSDIPQHPLREDLAKFSPNGLRTFVWNELDNPPIELFEGIEKFRQDLIKEGKEHEFRLYYREYTEKGLKCFEFKNPYRSGHLKLKKNRAGKSLNCGNFHPYRKDWVFEVNDSDYILMRAEIPLNHLWNKQGNHDNRSGAVFYAELIIRLMYSNYGKKNWDKNEVSDERLISQWLFCCAGYDEEHLIIYYLKPIMFEVDRMYLFESVLLSGRAKWKSDFLSRETEIAKLRTEIMGFPISERQYSYYANAFEFAIQVPCVLEDFEEDNIFESVSDLMRTGLLLGDKSIKYFKKLIDSKKKRLEKYNADKKVVDKKAFDELFDKLKAKWTNIIKHEKKITDFKYNPNDYDQTH